MQPVFKKLYKIVVMDTLSYKTKSANTETVNKEWIIIDADGAILGRLASQAAKMLRGKHKPDYTPHVDCGDNIIIINASKVKLTGQKADQKKYIRHSGYPGGQKEATYKEVLNKKPFFIIEQAVKGMLPKNRLGRKIYKNLFVYEGSEHPHQAQKPKEIKLTEIK